jgi:hypothetical protein
MAGYIPGNFRLRNVNILMFGFRILRDNKVVTNNVHFPSKIPGLKFTCPVILKVRKLLKIKNEGNKMFSLSLCLVGQNKFLIKMSSVCNKNLVTSLVWGQ